VLCFLIGTIELLHSLPVSTLSCFYSPSPPLSVFFVEFGPVTGCFTFSGLTMKLKFSVHMARVSSCLEMQGYRNTSPLWGLLRGKGKGICKVPGVCCACRFKVL